MFLHAQHSIVLNNPNSKLHQSDSWSSLLSFHQYLIVCVVCVCVWCVYSVFPLMTSLSCVTVSQPLVVSQRAVLCASL